MKPLFLEVTPDMKKQEGKNMQKTLELCKVRPGEVFTLDGVDFVKLADDQGASFVLTADVVLKSVQFEKEGADRECRNNFRGSGLEHCILGWLREHKTICDAITSLLIDLTTIDGMTDYGCPNTIARVLTIDEYRKYRRFIPLTDAPYWLATGYTTNSSPYSSDYDAYYVSTDGTLGYDYVYGADCAARTAFYLKPSVLVSVEYGDEEYGLEGFSNTELIDELYRRDHGGVEG